MVSILCSRRLACYATAAGIAHFAIRDSSAGALQIAPAARSEFARTSAGRNRADVTLLHRLPQACGLLLERSRPRQVVMRSEELPGSAISYGRRGSRTPARREAGA